jgi:hypothetical protein
VPDGGPAPESWLHPDVDVRPSTVAGRGLFATADLPVGTVVARFGGHLVEAAELPRLTADAGDPLDDLVVAEGVHLVPAPGDHRFVNHSCDPNLGWADAYALATTTDVSADQELLTDYAMSVAEPGWFLRCHCPSYRCRQMVEGSDWRIAALQQRYDGWWTPYVQSLVDAAPG